LWQWREHGARLDDGSVFTPDLYHQLRDEQLKKLQAERNGGPTRLTEAARLLDELVLSPDFVSFLTLSGYKQLD
ncbi:MAG: malate synthase A, partial [Longimicrobiales bacterium]